MIRPALVADAPAIARIHIDAWRVAYAGIIPQAHLDALDLPSRETRWKHTVEAGTGTTLVVEDGGVVRGWIAFGPSRDPDADPTVVAEIYAVYVDPLRWRHGFGRQLLDAARSRLVGHPITLWVLAANLAARGAYTRLGFRDEGSRKLVEFGGAQLEEFRYRRDR